MATATDIILLTFTGNKNKVCIKFVTLVTMCNFTTCNINTSHMTLFDNDALTESHSVLSKILNTKAANDKRIAQADLAYCERIQREYIAALDNLNKWEKIFYEELKTNWKGQYTISNHNPTSIGIYLKDDDRNTFNRLMFFCGDTLEKIHENKFALQVGFAKKITDYFNKEYVFNVEYPDKMAYKLTDFNPIIDYIFSQLKCSSLSDVGLLNAKEEFKNKVSYIGNVSVEKNRIELRRWQIFRERYYTSNQRERYEIEHHSKLYILLFKSLGLFESGELNNQIDCQTDDVRYFDFVTKFSFLNSTKFKSIKLFKNNKLIIYCKSEEIAQAFYNYFDLATLPKSRW